jgi:methyl-accepting chemotaxis protein
MKLQTKLLCIISVPLIFLSGLILLLFQHTERQRAMGTAAVYAESIVLKESLPFLALLNRGYAVSEQLAGVVAAFKLRGNTDRGQLVEIVRSAQYRNQDFKGVWLMLEPNALDVDAPYAPGPATEHLMEELYGQGADYAPGDAASLHGALNTYWVTTEDGTSIVPVAAGENTGFDEPYYTLPKTTSKTSFPDIYMDEDAKVLVSTIATPIPVNGTMIGVTGVDIGLAFLQRETAKIQPLETGFLTVYSRTGVILAAPDSGLLGQEMPDTLPAALREAVRQGKKYIYTAPAGPEGKDYLHCQIPLPFAGGAEFWNFVISLPLDMLTAESNALILRGGLIALAGLILVLALITVLIRRMTKDIIAGIAFADAIAAGRLDTEFPLRRNDEIGHLADALRRMIGWMRDTLAESRKLAVESASARKQSEESLAVIETKAGEDALRNEKVKALAARLDDIARNLHESTALIVKQIEKAHRDALATQEQSQKNKNAVSILESASSAVDRKVGQAVERAEAAKVQAVQGAEILKAVNQSVQCIAEGSREQRTALASLDKRVQGIGSILTVISDVADQTNLLALNAAIEAARAGEAGRGFAVVADEVRKLAEKTMQSIGEVGRVTSAIQASTRESITTMERSMEEIMDTAARSSQSSDTLAAIVSLVEQSSREVEEIVALSAGQAEASQSIVRATASVEAIAQTTAQEMQSAASHIQNLTELSRTLNDTTASLRQL